MFKIRQKKDVIKLRDVAIGQMLFVDGSDVAYMRVHTPYTTQIDMVTVVSLNTGEVTTWQANAPVRLLKECNVELEPEDE